MGKRDGHPTTGRAIALHRLALVLHAVAELPRDADADSPQLSKPYVIHRFTTHARLDSRGWTYTERVRRGPRSTVTPAQAWHDEQEAAHLSTQRDIYRRFETLPNLGRAAGWFEDERYVEALLNVIYDASINKRRRASIILDRLAQQRHRAPDPTTVREHLKMLTRD